MDDKILSLSPEHQWLIYALASRDIMLPEVAGEVVEDLGAAAADYRTFARGAFELYTASFAPEDLQGALDELQQLIEWATAQAATGRAPDFAEFEAEPEAPSRATIARALDDLRRS